MAENKIRKELREINSKLSNEIQEFSDQLNVLREAFLEFTNFYNKTNANKNLAGESKASVVSYAAASSESQAMCPSPRRFYEVKFPHFDGDGEKVREWVYKCERIFDFDQTPEDMKVKLASMHLEGTAIAWHQLYLKGRISSSPVGWCEYSKAVIERFSELDPWSELMNLRQMGSIQEYRRRFEFLCAQIKLREDYAVSIFINGLKPELQPAVKVFKPEDLARAYEVARFQEASLAAQIQALRSNLQGEHTVNDYNNKNSRFLNNGNTRKMTTQEINRKIDEGLCIWCNEKKIEKRHKCKVRPRYMIEVVEDSEEIEDAGYHAGVEEYVKTTTL